MKEHKITRRSVLTHGAVAAGTAMFAATVLSRNGVARSASAVPAPEDLIATSAGSVAAGPGPWKLLPEMPAEVRLENLYLKMPDGVRLNAFLYLPAHASAEHPVPALLNTTPYRFMPRDDSSNARNGYAALFVDVRGSGGSEGIPTDEYSHAEHVDTTHIIDWLSRQAWCNGNVGMYGSSYSAINSLQIAFEMKPPALKAIFLMCGSDDRYTDDIHCPGGSMLMVDNSWALGMLAMNAMPGAPDYVLSDQAAMDRWNQPPWLQGFLKNQVDGPYWRRGSLAPDYERLKIPTFLVGGYLDIYQNQVMRIMRHSTSAETRGVLGPWHHSLDRPGPAVDLDALRFRWFDHWLKGIDTGMLNEPRASFYLPSWRRQSFRFEDDIPGEWRFLDEWPDSAFEPDYRLYFRPEPERPVSRAKAMNPMPGGGGRLEQSHGPASSQHLKYQPGTGGGDRSFGPTGWEGYYGLDRRDEDVHCLCFDSGPLQESIEILGFARAKLFVSCSAPVANWIVRLCDVAADGTSYLLARGYLNGTHRESHTNPEPLNPGEVYELDITLMCTAYRFDPGHQIRISISNADFPVLWPSPQPFSTVLYTGGSRASHINLPVLPKLEYRDGAMPGIERRNSSRQPARDPERTWYEQRRDVQRGITTANFDLPLGGRLECRVEDSAPGYASMRISTSSVEKMGDREIEVLSEGSLSSTPDDFILDITADLREDGESIRKTRWRDKIKRQLV